MPCFNVVTSIKITIRKWFFLTPKNHRIVYCKLFWRKSHNLSSNKSISCQCDFTKCSPVNSQDFNNLKNFFLFPNDFFPMTLFDGFLNKDNPCFSSKNWQFQIVVSLEYFFRKKNDSIFLINAQVKAFTAGN